VINLALWVLAGACAAKDWLAERWRGVWGRSGPRRPRPGVVRPGAQSYGEVTQRFHPCGHPGGMYDDLSRNGFGFPVRRPDRLH